MADVINRDGSDIGGDFGAWRAALEPAEQERILLMHYLEQGSQPRKDGRPEIVPFDDSVQFKVYFTIARRLIKAGRIPKEGQPASIKRAANCLTLDAKDDDVMRRLVKIANGKGGTPLNDKADDYIRGLSGDEYRQIENDILAAQRSKLRRHPNV
jgi:hypothetical protein